jgi:hypothetical protein
MGMDKLFTLVGLGVPFSLAAATFAAFSWLDSNASDDATKVISSWLHGRSRNKPDLGNLIIKAFDRVYTSPLLTFRALRRSAAISSTVWLIIYFVPHFVRSFAPATYRDAVTLCLIVLTDYFSLFFVRTFLKQARTRPIASSIGSSIIGFLVLASSFLLLIILNFVILIAFGLAAHSLPWSNAFYVFRGSLSSFLAHLYLPYFFELMGPAFVIHLWLPLFALSSLAVRLVFWIFRAVEWAQWFLKQGSEHPLRAIGVVATIMVFGSAMLVKEEWALLSVLEHS